MIPEAAVGELFAAFAARDEARMERVVHPDCTFWAEGTSTAAGRAEPYHGPKGVQAYFEDAARIWDHLEVQPQDVRSAGEGVICFGVAVGRLRGARTAGRYLTAAVFVGLGLLAAVVGSG